MKKIVSIATVITMALTITTSATPWQWYRNELIYDSEIGFFGNVTLTFASDGGSFVRPVTTVKASATKTMSACPLLKNDKIALKRH